MALLGFALLFLPPLAAHAGWWLTSPRPLRLVLLDKTVPDRTFREHAGLVWILRNARRVRPDGRPFRLDGDYYGFHPLTRGRWEIRALPDSLPPTDLIYVADTRGVTAGALSGGEGEGSSRLLYGGLRADEVETLRTAVERGVPLVAELNTLGSLGVPGVRARMEELLGVEWTGWTGRWIPELADTASLPPGVVAREERRSTRSWTHRGPGLVMTHTDGRVLVLRQPVHLEGPGPTLHPDSAARSWGVRDGVPLHQEFAVVRPGAGGRVLAQLRLRPTPSGRELLDEAKLPWRFPAVVRRDHGGEAGKGGAVYYFAGDFADRGTVPGWHRFRFVPSLFRVLPMPPDDPAAFFWKAYVPLMHRVIQEAGG